MGSLTGNWSRPVGVGGPWERFPFSRNVSLYGDGHADDFPSPGNVDVPAPDAETAKPVSEQPDDGTTDGNV
jgi:hypothetical protein